MLHVACPCWRCSAWYVVEAAAQPGFFSRAKSARHESWRGCGPRVRPRWSLLGCGCASPAAIVRLCSSQATKMLACEPVCCVFVVSRCVRDACRCVTELACRLGSGRPQVCVKRAPAQRVSLSRVGSALRPLLKSIYLSIALRCVFFVASSLLSRIQIICPLHPQVCPLHPPSPPQASHQVHGISHGCSEHGNGEHHEQCQREARSRCDGAPNRASSCPSNRTSLVKRGDGGSGQHPHHRALAMADHFC